MAFSQVNSHCPKKVKKVRIERLTISQIQLSTYTEDGHVHDLNLSVREAERIWMVLAKHLNQMHKADAELKIEGE